MHAMVQEIKEQPALFARVLEETRSFLRPVEAYRSIHFLGCGDMDFAARTAAWLARGNVHAHRSMDLRWRAATLGKGDLVVAASFSGRTPRTLEAARLCRKRGAEVWGLTGNEEAPLLEEVDRPWVIHTGPQEELGRHAYAGYHHIVPQTKTFTAVLLAELLLLRAAGLLEGGDTLDRLSECTAKGLPPIEARVQGFMAGEFRPVERVAVLGSGPWRALAAYGSAKLLEMAIPARYQCLEENNHLEMFITQKEDLVVLLAPDAASRQRAKELEEAYREFGALVLTLDSAEGGDRITRVFRTAIELQLLCAAIGPALGRDIDQWVGGVRVKLIEKMGQQLVRGSAIIDF
jgi:fructoselysine-6-P-deglycase FrlB-like protein